MHPWHHWLVRRALPWGALAALLTCSRRDGSAFRPWRVAVWVILLAAACELGKLFIISRVANVANVLVTVVAALAGSLLGRYLLNPAQPRRLLCLLAGGLLLYLTYLEWKPFTFAFQLEQARSKWPTGTEWLPLYHYAMGARPEDVRLFVRTVSLTAGAAWSLLNCCPKTARSLRAKVLLPAAGGLVLGMLLEAGQFALPRIPSVTDVLCMGLGGGLGGLLAHRKPIRGAVQDEADPITDAPPGA
jgi:VanZ family protein